MSVEEFVWMCWCAIILIGVFAWGWYHGRESAVDVSSTPGIPSMAPTTQTGWTVSEVSEDHELWLAPLDKEDVLTIADSVTTELLRKPNVNLETIGADVARITRDIVEALESEKQK